MRDERGDQMAEFAAAHRMTYSDSMEDGLVDASFYLFSLDSGEVVGEAAHLVKGGWHGLPMRLFDFSMGELEGAEALGLSAYWTSNVEHTVAMVDVPASFPYIYVERKALLTRVADDLDRIDHLHHDHLEVECGVKEFDRAFEVKTAHAGFARELFHHGLMEAILAAGTDLAYEVSRSRFVVYGTQIGPADLPRLLDAAKAFHDRIPAELWSEYGPEGSSESSADERA